MSVEKIRPIQQQQLVRLLLTIMFCIVSLNLCAIVYLQYDQLNITTVVTAQKWKIVAELAEPVDIVIIGDSSANQGIDPLLIEEVTGLKGINLATVASWGMVDNVWLLEEYIQQHGVPPTVIAVYAFDTQQRDASLPDLLATFPVPIEAIIDASFVEDYTAVDWGVIYLKRLFPLYYRHETLRRATIEFATSQFGIFTPHYVFNSAGFLQWTDAYPARVVRSSNMRLVRIHNTEAPGAFSQANLAAMERLIAMADIFDFELYIAHGPIYEGLENDERFAPLRQALNETYTALVADRSNVAFIPTVATFRAEVMENFNHLIVDAAHDYTLQLVDWIWGAD